MSRASPFRVRKFLPGLGLLGLALLCSFASAAAKETPAAKKQGNSPPLVQADRMAYDQQKGIITAAGHVEVVYGGQILHADKIVYDQNSDIVRAEGHISILQPSGEVMFAKQAELTSDMKQGFVDEVQMLFPDNSRLAARDAQRYEGRYLVADYGVYTACNLCAEKPEKPPLWQLKGVRVTHDSETKDVIYRDATLEMDGIPVLFSPYFSHPDSTVKRRQGFLTPSGGFSQELGTFARVPYYFDIAPNDDAVLMPIFSTTDILQLGGEWRHRFSHGNMLWSGSFTHTDLVDEYGVGQGSQWRGHLFGNTLFNLDRQWRAGTDVALTSDKSYLRRYNITSEDLLVNRGYVEGFRGRGYTVGNLYYFQDLRPGKQLTEPFVAPEIRFSALGDPGKTLGGRWSMDGGLLMTSRNRDVDPAYQGPDTRRLSFDAGWERQMVSSTGFLFNLSGLVRLDGYWANNVPDPTMPVGGTFSDITSVREFAQGDISLRYPLGRRGDGYQQIVEPISVLSVAPKQKSDSLLPNEDSLDVEFDETNLFAPNRFTGIDRLEGGTRAAYGLRHALIGDNGAQIEMVGGQVYRFRRDESFPDNSGLRDQLSDFVGRFDVAPAPWLNVSYGFRLSPNNVKFERQEAQISAGVPLFRPYVRYITVQQSEILSGVNTIPSTVEEATFGFSSKFAKYWSIFAAHTQSFQPTPGPRTTTAGFGYSDECFQFGLTAQRNNTDRQDIRSGTTVMFHFYLKNIGGIQTDSSNQESFTPSLTPSATTSGQNREPF